MNMRYTYNIGQQKIVCTHALVIPAINLEHVCKIDNITRGLISGSDTVNLLLCIFLSTGAAIVMNIAISPI